MADKNIGLLPKATDLDDNSLLIAEQQGSAVSVPGSLFKSFVRDRVDEYTEDVVEQLTDAVDPVAQESTQQEVLSSTKKILSAINEISAVSPPIFLRVTLTAGGWSGGAQTVTAQGVLADEMAQFLQVAPSAQSAVAYHDGGVYLAGRGGGSLTFRAETAPAKTLIVYVCARGVSTWS
jgi:hypothetical protein